MGEVRLILPDDELVAVDMRIDGKPFVGVINRGLAGFAHKEVFGWCLSVIIDYAVTVGNGMPDKEETEKMQDFSESLSRGLSGNQVHPNALFLGRVTGDGYSEIIWYVNDPDRADKFLKELISTHGYALEFDYEMTYDPAWEEGDYWLQSAT